MGTSPAIITLLVFFLFVVFFTLLVLTHMYTYLFHFPYPILLWNKCQTSFHLQSFSTYLLKRHINITLIIKPNKNEQFFIIKPPFNVQISNYLINVTCFIFTFVCCNQNTNKVHTIWIVDMSFLSQFIASPACNF